MSVVHRFAILVAFAFPTLSVAQVPRNDTGLPTYPHLREATVQEWNLNHKDLYHVFKSSTTDTFADVVAWYKSQLPKATAGAKDDGIELETKLTVGRDIVNIYDLHQFGENAVEVDLLKYKAAAPGA